MTDNSTLNSTDYEDDSASREEFLDAMRKIYDVIVPAPNQLTLDLDHVTYREELANLNDWFWTDDLDEITRDKVFKVISYLYNQFGGNMKIESWASKSGKTHVLITMNEELPAIERCLFQSLLGSDPVREMLNLRRVQHDVKDPICLFKPNAEKYQKLSLSIAEEDWA